MRYMLDTNMVSYFLRKNVNVEQHVLSKPIQALCISSITQAELLYGLAKRPNATRVNELVNEFLRRVEALPWDSSAAEIYAKSRASLEKNGRTVAPMDLLIGSHALSVGVILVTSDKAFKQVKELVVENWAA
jgi:tRNA(fMet)-specific endonuclease VapC